MSQIRYPVRVVLKAQEHAEAGWAPAKIKAHLEREFGISPSLNTVSLWANPERRERYNQQRRLAANNQRTWGWRRRLQRMRELRDAGLSFHSIALLLELDHRIDLSEHQVADLIEGVSTERTAKRLLGWVREAVA